MASLTSGSGMCFKRITYKGWVNFGCLKWVSFQRRLTGQAEDQAVSTEGESQVVDSQVVVTDGQETVEQTVEKPKKPKVDRRPYILYLTEVLEQPQDRKILLKTILEKWPTVSKGGCQTFLTDMLNARYTFFKDRPVIKLPDGRVVFKDQAPIADKVQEASAEPSPVEVLTEAPTDGLQPEQAGE
ncbi:MAG: hypothetical protein ABSF90_21210 [Syntrophobacteraceae bacterium]